MLVQRDARSTVGQGSVKCAFRPENLDQLFSIVKFHLSLSSCISKYRCKLEKTVISQLLAHLIKGTLISSTLKVDKKKMPLFV